MDGMQRVKIGQSYSEWLNVWGTVPQGTLLRVLCFLCLINDLSTSCKSVKYVDDTTIYHISSDLTDGKLQESADQALSWSSKNSMNINSSKTKELLISFAKSQPDIPPITIKVSILKGSMSASCWVSYSMTL